MSFPDDPRSLKVLFGFGTSTFAYLDDPDATVLTQVAPNPDDEADPGPVLGPVRITRGRTGGSSTTDPTRIQFGLRDTDGDFSRRNVNSPYFGQLREGVPVRIAVDVTGSDSPVATAGVQKWEPTWDGPDINDRVPIDGLGFLGWLGRDQTSFSPIRHGVRGDLLRGYWSCEDGTLANTLNAGVVPTLNGATLELLDDVPAGTAGAVRITASAYLSRPLLPITSYTPVSGAVTLAFWLRCDSGGVGTVVVEVTGTAASVVFVWNDSGVSWQSGAGSGSAASSATVVNDGEWHLVECVAEENGADLDLSLSVDGVALDTGSYTGRTLDQMTSVRSLAYIAGGTTQLPFDLMHLAVYDSDAAGYPAYAALDGYVGEMAHERIDRVLTEAGAPGIVLGTISAAMGAQPHAAKLAILREAEGADHGVLYETRPGRIRYETVDERYNATVALTLTYGTEAEPGDVSDLVMDDDDRVAYNIVTASALGESATVEVTDGPQGSNTVAGIGPRPVPITVNVESADQLVHQAGWLARHGTIDQPRWTVVLNPFTEAALRTAVLACDIGSRIQTSGAPAKHAGPNDLDLIIEGETIVEIDADRWTVAWQCEPFEPFEVRVWGEETSPDLHEHLGRWGEPEGTHIETGIDEDDTTITVDSGEAGLWTVDDDEFDTAQYTPLLVTFGGEIARVTDITDDGGGLYTFTVVRGVNGVTKSHEADDPLAVYRPLIWAL